MDKIRSINTWFLGITIIGSILILIFSFFNGLWINDLFSKLSIKEEYVYSILDSIINVSGILAGFVFTGTSIILSMSESEIFKYLEKSNRLSEVIKSFINSVIHFTILIIYALIIKFFSFDILVLNLVIMTLYSLIEFWFFLNKFSNIFETNERLKQDEERILKKEACFEENYRDTHSEN